MSNLNYRAVAHRAEADPSQDRTIRFIASTSEPDRYDSVVAQDWKLEAFNRNPVFLWMHNMRVPPIGRVNKWETGVQQSTATVRFANTPFADEIYGLYLDEMLNAVSVGFSPSDYKFIDNVIVLTGNELFELSAVTVPGNASALVEGRAAGRTKHIDDWARRAFGAELGRTPDAQDLTLLQVGAQPAHIDILRSFDSLDKRVAALEAIQTKSQESGDEPEDAHACEVVRVILQEDK